MLNHSRTHRSRRRLPRTRPFLDDRRCSARRSTPKSFGWRSSTALASLVWYKKGSFIVTCNCSRVYLHFTPPFEADSRVIYVVASERITTRPSFSTWYSQFVVISPLFCSPFCLCNHADRQQISRRCGTVPRGNMWRPERPRNSRRLLHFLGTLLAGPGVAQPEDFHCSRPDLPRDLPGGTGPGRCTFLLSFSSSCVDFETNFSNPKTSHVGCTWAKRCDFPKIVKPFVEALFRLHCLPLFGNSWASTWYPPALAREWWPKRRPYHRPSRYFLRCLQF